MRRLLPLLVIVVLAAVTFALLHEVGWNTLAHHQARLQNWNGLHPFAAVALYLLAYILVASLSLPQAAILTLIGGWLFGPILGTMLTILSATTGACILLLVIRSAFASALNHHRHRIPQQVQTRLAQDGFSYLLALRLLPVFPFWLVNLAAAVSGIRLPVFALATLLGIMPVTYIFSSIGAGLGTLLSEGHTPDLSLLLSFRIFLPLAGLAGLSLLPALLRRRFGAHA